MHVYVGMYVYACLNEYAYENANDSHVSAFYAFLALLKDAYKWHS